MNAPSAPHEDIDVHFDASHKQHYFVHRKTGRSSWVASELMDLPPQAPASGPAATAALELPDVLGITAKGATALPTSMDAAPASTAAAAHDSTEVEVKFDEAHERHYFVHRKTKRVSWVASEVREVDAVLVVLEILTAMLNKHPTSPLP